MSAYPREAIPMLPENLVQGVKSTQQRIQPSSGTQAMTVTGISSGQKITFSIDQQAQTMLDPQTLCLCGRVEFGNMGTENVDVHCILGSILSAFSQIRVLSNKQEIDNLMNPGPLYARLWDMSLDRSAKQSLANMRLFDPVAPGSQGAIFGTSNTVGNTFFHNSFPDNNKFSFCIPVPCVISALTSLFPLHSSSLDFEFTLDSPANRTRQFMIGAAITPTATFSSMELVFQSLRFESGAFGQILASTPTENGMLVLKSSVWEYGNTIIPATAPVGRFDCPYTVQSKSIKKIVLWASPSGADAGLHAGVNPNLQSIQLSIAGGAVQLPQQPLSVADPGYALMENYRSMGALFSSANCGCIHPMAFARASTRYNDYHNAYLADTLLLSTPIDSDTSISTFVFRDATITQNKWFLILDCETLGDHKPGVLHGQTTRGSSGNVIRLNIATPLAAQPHTFQHWTESDVRIYISLDAQQTVLDK
eukprot:gene24659-29794_t